MTLEVAGKLKPLYTEDKRFKGLRGGRGSSKSWAIVDYILFRMINNQDLFTVCLREIQKSIKHSSKKLLEDRINYHKLHDHFDVMSSEIKCKGGTGLIVFAGLQDHTADSIKSMEGADICFVEEAQTITQHSLDLLVPTIRKEGSELLFSWNPRLRTDAVERLFKTKSNSILVHINYTDNPFCSQVIKDEAEEMRLIDAEKYHHIFLGGYVDTTGNKLFRYQDIDAAMHRNGNASGATIIGADIARYGDDSTVLVIRSGLWVKSILQKRKLSITEVADWISTISRLVNADAIVVDTIGIGAGVHDILIRKGEFSIDGNFGMRAADEKTYFNKRAESYFKFAEAFKRGLSIPEQKNEELMEELLEIEYTFSETGKAKIIPKDKIKENLGRSPDLSDALALTYFTDVLTNSSRGVVDRSDPIVPNLY